MKKRTFFNSSWLFYSEELWGPSHIWRIVGYHDFEITQYYFKSYLPDRCVLIGTRNTLSNDCQQQSSLCLINLWKRDDTLILSLSRLEEYEHILKRTKENHINLLDKSFLLSWIVWGINSEYKNDKNVGG